MDYYNMLSLCYFNSTVTSSADNNDDDDVVCAVVVITLAEKNQRGRESERPVVKSFKESTRMLALDDDYYSVGCHS